MLALSPTGRRFGWLAPAIDLVLPPRCPACRVIVDGDDRFCADCFAQLAFITAPVCACCGVPLPHDGGPDTQCGGCLATPPRFTTARSAFIYGGPVRSVVLGLKHGDRQHLAGLMARAMLRAAGGALPADALLVPVPLHRWRLWRRGHNQAATIARALARISGAALAVDALLRVKPTPSTRGLGRTARQRNVVGAFRVRAAEQVKGREVVLVDDVFTTGATVEACAGVLRRAGARHVHVLTFARAIASSDAKWGGAPPDGEFSDGQG